MFDALGATLRVLRERAGCSQAELARRARIGKSQLSKYENGKELPRLESLAKVVAALGTTPLVVFYVSSVLESAAVQPAGLRAEIFLQPSGPLLTGRESRGFRELFDHCLDLHEAAVEARIGATLPRKESEETWLQAKKRN
jgi:transcriptional regulator with XRE-family HTH domain